MKKKAADRTEKSTPLRAGRPTPQPGRQQVFERAMSLLREFFEAGMVIVTWTEGNKTYKINLNFGNAFTVEGLCESLHGHLGDGSDEGDDDYENFLNP
jgi:hypothetical protein